MKTANRNVLIAFGLLALALAFGAFLVPLTWAAKAGVAVGGMLLGALAFVFALVVVGLVLAGVSLLVVGVLAFVAVAVVVALSPLWLPVLLLLVLIGWAASRGQGGQPQQA